MFIEKEVQSVGFWVLLEEMALLQMERILDLTAGDDEYEEADKELHAAQDAFNAANLSKEAKDTYLELEAAFNHIAVLEAVAMYKKGLLDGLMMGLKKAEKVKRAPIRKTSAL